MNAMEPTPRMIIAQLKEIEREKNRIHEKGIHEILRGREGEKEFAESDRLKEDLQSLRDHLRNSKEA